MFTIPVMYPAFLMSINPINSNTIGIINTCIKTLLLCWRPEPSSSICTRVRIYDPARWTADIRCRFCCGLVVIWVSATHIQTNITVLVAHRHALCWRNWFYNFICTKTVAGKCFFYHSILLRRRPLVALLVSSLHRTLLFLILILLLLILILLILILILIGV